MRQFLKNIKYLLEYLLIVLAMNILLIFGIDRAADIGSFIARKVGKLLNINKIARKNLKKIFGNTINVSETIDQLWDNFGRFIGEFPYINKLSEEELLKRIEIIGYENVVELQKQRQPFLLFTGHFANWEIVLKVIYKLYPKFAVVYRRANNPYMDKLINKSRNNKDYRLVPKGYEGRIGLIRALKQRESIVMLVDQKMNEGIEVPFLGRSAMTPVAIAKIALQFQYPIIPAQIVRTKGSNFRFIIHPQLQFDTISSPETGYYNIMLMINNILGKWVKQNPSQWFWFHNRWKE